MDYGVFWITENVLHMNIIRSTFFGQIMPNVGLQRSRIKKVPLY
jgi:hypothetical protein